LIQNNCLRQTLEKTEGAIKNGQSRETDNIGYTRRRKTIPETQDYLLCIGHSYMSGMLNIL